MAGQGADVLVIFGITGDLAKKMTFRALYRLERRKRLQCPIVGVAGDGWSSATLREHARRAIEDTVEMIDEEAFQRLAERMSMISGDFGDPKTYDRLAKAIEGRHAPVFYLEIPPSLFGRVVDSLAVAGLTKHARVVVEKPFGHDLASARALNAELRRLLDESQIYRIDHFLGKEPAQDILFLRLANSIFEPMWNRDHVQSVQITMAEDFGVADRGSFYDPVGALRDVVQNHLLQLVALMAAEPPSTGGADLMVQAKRPGAQTTRTVDLSLIFSEELGDAPEPYERLLGDALMGDASLFTREDSVEQTWRIVQPLLDAPPPVEPYPQGSWGPEGANKLLAGHPGWRKPWLHSHMAR